ncbi:MAG TPA: Ig-like domain-containing protein [Terracidiphilus sp.]|nr:Ig-like domain-containing protein [Terracidiphilus sp.]
MHDRVLSPRVLLLVALVLPIAGCSNPLAVSVSISPTTQTIGAGQTAQFTATGVFGHGSNHPSSSQDLTNSVTWSSSAPSVATISASGVATGVSAGTTTITASINGFTGVVSATAALTVTGTSGGQGGPGTIAIIPNTQLVTMVGDTAQFQAIETTTTGSTVDVTNLAHWVSSSPSIATIVANTGLATAMSLGSVTISASYTAGGSTLTGTATLTVGSGSPGGGGSTEEYTAVTTVPSAQSVSASGQTGQFIALATLGSNGLEQDVTNSPQTTWESSIPSVATVATGLGSGNGLATGVSLGTSTITAELKNPDGSLVSSSSTLNVTNTPAPEPLLSLSIVPGAITVGNLLDAGQFLAIGTYSTSPTVRDLTNSVQWLTSAPSVFPVNTNGTGVPSGGANAGVVTAYGNGSATIIAEATDPQTGSIQTSTATFSCPLVLPTPTTAGSCYPGSEASSLLSTLTVYNEGLNTTNWLVTAPSATGTPNVLHCGPGSTGAGLGGSVCVATYPVGTTVTLTAPAGAGAFGGWSYNCVPQGSVTAAGPNTCQVTLTFDDTVGAIFN